MSVTDPVADPIPMMESTMQVLQQLHVNVRFEDGSFWATVDEFPGVFATGDDLDELRESLQEGIALVLVGPREEPPTVTLASLPPEPATTTVSAELIYA
jgi:predicted RNase H-like HicB family nuclease